MTADDDEPLAALWPCALTGAPLCVRAAAALVDAELQRYGLRRGADVVADELRGLVEGAERANG